MLKRLRNLTLAALLTLPATTSTLAQSTPSWGNVEQFGGTGQEVVFQVALDAAGNRYILGAFRNTITFGSTTFTSLGRDDLYLLKYTPQGALQWARQMSGTAGEFAGQLKVDAAGNAYVSFISESPTLTTGTTVTSGHGGQDYVLARFDPQGNTSWVTHGGGTGSEYVIDLALDPNGGVYLTGYFAASGTFGSATYPAQGLLDGYVARFDAQGQLQWVRLIAGPNSDSGQRVAAAPNGDVLLYAFVEGNTVLAGSAPLPATVLTLARLDAQGQLQWVRQANGAVQDMYSLATDAQGNVYAAGSFTGPLALGSQTQTSAGGQDAFVVKLNPQGGTDWLQRYGGSADETIWALNVTRSGSMVVAGGFSGATTTLGTVPLTAIGGAGGFGAGLTSTGQVAWALSTGAQASSIAVSGQQVLLGGIFTGTTPVGPTSLTSRGQTDAFLAELNLLGPLATRRPNLTVTPNPASGPSCQVLLPAGTTELRLYNSLGQVVRQQRFPTTSTRQASIEVAGLPAGRYQLQLTAADGVASAALIVP